MNENGKKKREWVKTAAIVFLSVMLLLTFFSNTIMNYSLPEVATQYVQSGTITAKIRGSGVVESGDPYNVEVKESRKVASVAVKTGDTVQKGDVLLYLEDQESEELKTAKAQLETLKMEFDQAITDGDTSTSIINKVQTGNITSTESKLAQIDACNNKIDALQNNIEVFNKRIAEIEAELSVLEDDAVEQKAVNDAKAELEKVKAWVNSSEAKLEAAKGVLESVNSAVDVAEKNKKACDESLEAAKGNYTALLNRKESLEQKASQPGGLTSDEQTELDRLSGSGEGSVTAASKAVADAGEALLAAEQAVEVAKASIEEERSKAQNAVDTAKGEYDQAVAAQTTWEGKVADAERNLANKQAGASDGGQRDALRNEKAELELNLKKATAEKEETDQKLKDLLAGFSKEVDLSARLSKIQEQQKLVDELTAKAVNATITAPISGTVTQLNVTAGKNTDASTPVAVLQPEGKGYTLSFSVTNEQARRLSVGDVADLVNAWYYDDVTVTLANIKPDTTDPGKKKLLTFDVTGSVTAGQTLNISVGQKSANYDYIVPNSAIREDNNGKFILIVESKQGPLSTRYIASRVDVEVLASDDTQSAVSAALYGYEFVITTSTKPVEAGKQVRLSNNN